jgi:hypothetical protein
VREKQHQTLTEPFRKADGHAFDALPGFKLSDGGFFNQEYAKEANAVRLPHVKIL